jgi:neutral ceramidase
LRFARWRRRLARLGLVPLVAYGLLLVDWRWAAGPPRPPVLRRQAQGTGPLEVGAARVPLTLALPVVMGGYGPRRADADRVRDPLAARALVLRAGETEVALVLLDVVLVPEELVQELEARLVDLGLDGLWVTASHTHSSTGGFDRRLLAQVVGMGRYRRDVEVQLLAAAEEAVRAARARLGRTRVRVGRETLAGWAFNRSTPGGPVDDELTVIALNDDDGAGAPRALLAVAAGHPTLLARFGTELSAEYPGAAMRRLEQAGGVAFVLQGAEGDAALWGKGDQAVEEAGSFLADRVAGAARRAVPTSSRLAYAEVTVGLPAPEVVALRSFWWRRPASNLALTLLSRSARVAALTLGEATLLAVPGEPTAEAARRLRAHVGENDRRPMRVVALTQGYLGYVVTPEDVRARRGEARRTWFGPDLLDRLGEGLRLAAVSPGPRPLPPP